MSEPGAGTPSESNPEETVPHCYRHPDRPTYVACVRCGRSICPECMRPAAVGFQCPEELKQNRAARVPRTLLGGPVTASGRDATSVIIAINVVVFVIMTASGTSFLGSHISLLFARFAEIPGRVRWSDTVVLQGTANGDWFRLFTSMFLHFGILHIASNMYVLFLVGPALERALGRMRFVALYLAAGFGGSVASFLLSGPTSIAAGASGAIFGLFGAYYVVARRLGGETGPIVGTIVLNLVISVAIPNIDIRAHLGGLVVGALLGAVLAYAPRERRNTVQAGGFLVVVVALVVLSVARGSVIRKDEAQPALGLRSTTAVAVPAAPRSSVSSPTA